MRHVAALILCILSGSLLAQESQPQAAATATRVRFDTSMGSFTIKLETERAPLTVENFLSYVRAGHYNGTIFHRVVPNFVAQGGAFTAEYEPRQTRTAIVNEAGNGLSNRRGTVGMARLEKPHSATCQFYVNLADNPDLDPLPSRWGYAVFGEVVEGMDVVDRIGHVPTGAAGPLKQDAPLKPVVIEKAALLE